jgi:hypothetical protein
MLLGPVSFGVLGANLAFKQVNDDGFGEYQNSFAWSAAEFNGMIYFGTNRNFSCVESATLQYYYPDENYYPDSTDPAVTCPLDPLDMNLQAEIWRTAPGSETWERVYQSPSDLLIPDTAPAKSMAPEIGFRDMTVFQELGGTVALYAASVSARPFIPDLLEPTGGKFIPRILRSTNGVDFAPLPLPDLEEFLPLGDADILIGFRSIAGYDGRLFVIATPGLRGDGWLLESSDPAGGDFHLVELPEPSMRVYELAEFNGFLYIGIGTNNGYGVLKTNAKINPSTGTYDFTPIVTGGAGRSSTLTVVSMHPFKNRLYVGANGWGGAISAELIRINPDDTWDLVAGRPRQTDSGFKNPISGLRDGMNNPFNVHFWHMADKDGVLYVGTNDGSWRLHSIPSLDRLLKAEYGFDLFKSADGVHWSRVTRNGFGNPFRFGVRSFVPHETGLYMGTTDHVDGTGVYLGTAEVSCKWWMFWCWKTQPASALQAESVGGTPVLSWEPSRDATLTRVFRAENLPNTEFAVQEVPLDAEFVGEFVDVGATTSGSFFRDVTAMPGKSYSYYVQAESKRLQPSEQSNMVVIPGTAPPVTLAQLDTLVEQHSSQGKILGAKVGFQLKQTRAALGAAAYSRADTNLARLQSLLSAKNGPVTDQNVAEEIGIAVAELRQRLRLANQGIISAAALIDEANL